MIAIRRTQIVGRREPQSVASRERPTRSLARAQRVLENVRVLVEMSATDDPRLRRWAHWHGATVDLSSAVTHNWVGVKATARAGKISGHVSGMVVHHHARDHAETLQLHLNGCTLRSDASSARALIGSFAARTSAFASGPGAAFDVALPITHPNELRMLGVPEPEVASGEYSGTIMKLRQLSPPVSSPVEVFGLWAFPAPDLWCHWLVVLCAPAAGFASSTTSCCEPQRLGEPRAR